MHIIELRDHADARRFLTQGLWLQRVLSPRQPGGVAPVLSWAFEVAAEGAPLPPLGFVADVGNLVFSTPTALSRETLHLPEWPAGLVRAYEDYVLGKLFN